MSTPEERWDDLCAHGQRLATTSIGTLLANDGSRFGTFSRSAAGLLVDFSKEKLDEPALAALLDLAAAVDLKERRDALLRGDHVNTTEDRAARHATLRASPDMAWADEGVAAERSRMLDFAEAIRSGGVGASDGAPFTDIVCIGTGGSGLGPEMAARVLSPWHDGPRLHFVSNVDGAHISDALRGLDPARTLVTLASKSFTTRETIANAMAARKWLGACWPAHAVAMTSRLDRATEFGVTPERVFTVPEWVGGRFSLWSSVGLPLAIAIGRPEFEALLRGAAEMDRHFAEAALSDNLPVLLALIGVWRRNVQGCGAVAVVPYSQRLSRFPAFLQQLEMESNGKQTRADGTPVAHATAPVIFGEPGTDAQHSFFQLLHQGTDVIPVDFIVAAQALAGDDPTQHDLLVASALAQASALAMGEENPDPHRAFAGDRPSTMIVLDRLDPSALGALIALFEHKVFCQGVLWGINSLDQFGVELGKRLTDTMLPLIADGDRVPGIAADQATRDLAAAIRSLRD